MNHYYLFPITKAQLQAHIDLVRQCLMDFALAASGAALSWVWLPEPTYHNSEAKVHFHPWLGALQKQAPHRVEDFLTPEDGLAVYLEGRHTYHVATFRDYGYNIQDTSIAYLTVTELSLSAGTTIDELRSGLERLHSYLVRHPIPIATRGLARPVHIDVRKEVSPGIWLRQRILNKHS